jgi:hypothetical protein
LRSAATKPRIRVIPRSADLFCRRNPRLSAQQEAYIYAIPMNGKTFVGKTQLAGQPPLELSPEGNGNFFANVVEVRISFRTEPRGKISGLLLHQNGRDFVSPRVDDASADRLINEAAIIHEHSCQNRLNFVHSILLRIWITFRSHCIAGQSAEVGFHKSARIDLPGFRLNK